jgi:hypothetical protein
MNLPRLRRRLITIAAAVAGVAILLYLLRWPLLGGLVRSRIAAVIAEELEGDLAEARFSGSLLFGAAAEDVVVRGRPDAAYREIRVRSARASYGLLGLGRLEVDVEGVEAVFVDPDPERPADGAKTVRDAETIVRRFTFPGVLRGKQGVVVLPDGTRIDVREAYADPAALRAQARVPGFGEVEASLDRRPGGFTARASAGEGPVRRARVDRDGDDLRIALEVEGREVEGRVRLAPAPDGSLHRAAGEFSAALGRARVEADFDRGRVEARVDLAHDLQDPVRARVSAVGRVAGPLLGPLRDWTVDGAVVRAERATWGGIAFDAVRVDVPDATLDAFSWKATARRGPDRFEGEGRYRRGGLEGTLRAALETTAPYTAAVSASDVEIRGRFRADEAFRFTGRVTTGSGEAAGVGWSALDAEVDVGPHGVEAPAARVKGLPGAPDVALSGTVDFLKPGYAVAAVARAGEDRLEVEGLLDEAGRFEGRLAGAAVLEGVRVRAAGRVVRDGPALSLALEPGEIGPVRHGPLRVRVVEGRATVEETDVELADPGATARVAGTAAWTEGRLSGDVRARNVRVRGAALGGLSGRFARADGAEEIEVDAAWTGEGGAGAELRGRWGPASDLQLRGRVPDLAAPWLRPLLGEVRGLAGGVEADVRATGAARRPELSGRVSVLRLSVAGTEPLSFDLPVRAEGRRAQLDLVPLETPYGRLSMTAQLPLPGSGAPFEARARLEARNLPAFARFVPEALRPHVPEGELDVDAEASGTSWRATAALRVLSGKSPEPFGDLTVFSARAELDPAGLRVERASGRLGGGPFEGSLRWDWDGPLRAELRGRELLAVSTKLSRIRVTADVALTREPGETALLAGTVDVPLAILHEEPGSPGGGGGDGGLAVGGLRLRPAPDGGVAVPGVPDVEGVRLDLRVRSSGEVRVENSIVGAMLQVDGRLRGTLQAPSASGSATVKSGEVKLPAAIFVRIEEARVEIPTEAGVDPFVHFVGRVGKGEGSIEIRVHGPLARPDLTLRSEPPRPEEELLARLAFGHAPGEVEGTAALGTLAFRIFEQYAAGWPTAEPQDGFFSNLRPTVVPAEEVEAHRAPWTLPPGRSPRGMMVRTEYLWTRHFSIVGEADREANVGGDMKLRLRFR